MARIVISENVSLDGVAHDPTGDDGASYGGWFLGMSDGDRAAWGEVEYGEAKAAEALLLGRRTDAWFGERWNDRPGEWAERLREMPKYVVSSTIDEPAWGRNSTVLNGDDLVAEVSRLKEELDGDVVVYGSLQLARALWEHGLVDELRLIVFPVVVGGAGEGLYGRNGGSGKALRLLHSRPVGQELTYQAYEVARDAQAS